MKKIEFTKVVAAGNDFIVLDNEKLKVKSKKLKVLAKKMCQRKNAIGADGLLVLEKSKKADYKMRIFNPDGSEPEMCGNGIRCFALFMKEQKKAGPKMKIETLAGILNAEVKKNNIKIGMSDPLVLKLNMAIRVNNRSLRVNCIDTGVPHVVVFVEDIDLINIKDIGRSIRFYQSFKPRGTNVNFVQVAGKNSIKIRTYERGVEDETLACGTGSVASAIISAVSQGLKQPIKVQTKSGETLKVYFKDGNYIHDVYLEGKASIVYTGVITM